MSKQLKCSDLMPGCTCTFTADGKDGEEVLAKLSQHAKNDHGMPGIPDAMIAKVRAALANV